MRRRDWIAGALTCAAATAADGSIDHEKLHQARRLIERSPQVRSGSLAVSHQGRGVASGEPQEPARVYLIASITKPMTAAGVMILADRGELSIEDPAARHLPEFSDGARSRITIRHLLTHTSGLPDQLPENADLRRAHAPLEEFVERAMRTELLFAPGAEYRYQSMGILLAAEIVQRISGRPFREFLKTELFAPLGMDDTALGMGKHRLEDTQQSQVEHAAPEGGGGSPEARSWDWNSSYWRDFGSPWGGAHSTVDDVTRFLQSFLYPDGKVLKIDTAGAMLQDYNSGLGTPRGLGFQLGGGSFGRGCSEPTFGHGGSTGTLAWADPERELTFVALTTLPARASRETVLRPASDLVSEAVG